MCLAGACLVGLLACRPGAGEEAVAPEPEPPVAKFELPSLEPPPEPVDLSPDPLPEGVVAEVDGEPIFEAELQRLVQAAPPEAEPDVVRSEALLQLVEHRLLEASADTLGILVSDAEIDQAVRSVAQTNGLTEEQLRDQVAEAGFGWEQYRQEITTQIVEMKVLQVHGVLDPARAGGESVEVRRERLLGCMRARAEIQVEDEALTLPENPFGVRTEIETLRFVGELGLPEDVLRDTAREAAESRMHLCDALTTAELALHELYVEHGFLEAYVQLPWPASVTPPVTIEAQVRAGRPHTVGTIRFDQSAVPRRKRIAEDDLRARVGLFLTEGEVAKMSAMQEASREVSEAVVSSGLGPVEPSVERKERKGSVRVNITYRVLGGG